MKFTPAQCRAAFYQAAANIEAQPELYAFTAVQTGDDGCAACMWGHVGRVLEMPSRSYVEEVALAMGFSRTEAHGASYAIYAPRADGAGFNHQETNGDFMLTAIAAAARLRAFADHHWPAESTEPVRPDLKECGMSFTELLQHINGETA